jgi:hypothetical protein
VENHIGVTLPKTITPKRDAVGCHTWGAGTSSGMRERCMPKKQDRQESEKRGPGRPQERVSLKPLAFEEALSDLLKTPPQQEQKRDKPPRKTHD